MIFDGDPGVDFKASRFMCLIWCDGVNRTNIEELHDAMCNGIDMFAAAPLDLEEACDEAALPLLEKGVVTDIVRMYSRTHGH
jgi:hypothetical protein